MFDHNCSRYFLTSSPKKLRQRDRLIAELRREQDEANDAEDYDASIEVWREAFGMEMTDNGSWTWKPFWDEYAKLTEKYYDLVKHWNRAVTILNAGTQDVGRPLAASETQVAAVLKLRKQGLSLRDIADETSLSKNTVCTIVGRKHGTDRTSNKRRKIAIDQHERAHWKAQKRTGDALPKRVQEVIRAGEALVREAKGI
jgi:hypothetical protein